MDRPDAADVVAAAAGDVDAFERLVRCMHGHVWRYLVHLTGDSGLAEDVAQEVFWRVHRKLATLRNPDLFVPWLYAMARNAALDAGRRRSRRPTEVLDGVSALESGTAPDPALSFLVHEALAELHLELREAIVLVGLVGLTYVEAGEALGVPAGTVKSRVFRARKQLLEKLDDGL